MVIENVRGAIPWVGRSRWNFGSFYLWGDVPALMPPTKHAKVGGMKWYHPDDPRHVNGQGFSTIADHKNREGAKVASEEGRRTDIGNGVRFTSRDCGIENDQHVKLGGSWFHGYRKGQGPRNHGSNSKGRNAASAMIAKIPEPLSRHIARCYLP